MAQTGDCTRKCKEIGEVTLATKTRSGVEVATSFKRRKLATDVSDHHQFASNSYDVVVNSPANPSAPAPAIPEDSGHASVSLCSSDDSSEFATELELRSVDPKVESYAEGYETEISKLVKCSRETTPSSEISSNMADELQSSTAASHRRRHPEAKTPAAAEIEEFFAAAEKQEQKRFADKYNYDVKKNVPLEGRYQWVRLKP